MCRVEGYMTVEASFIVPMVIGIFAFIIYLTNFSYARCVLVQDTYVLAFRASQQDLSEAHGYIAEKSDVVAEKKYFGNLAPEFKTRVNGKNVEITGKTTTRHAVLEGFFRSFKGDWDIEEVQTARKRDYSGHVRSVKRIKDIGVSK